MMGEYGLRLEDYGRQTMNSLPVLSIEMISKGLTEYLGKQENEYFMLLSNKLGYYQVFNIFSNNLQDRVDNIISFLSESKYFQTLEDNLDPIYTSMMDIKHYEINEDYGHLELWIGNEYFQLFPYDWGVVAV
jgi:hypothetical protein